MKSRSPSSISGVSAASSPTVTATERRSALACSATISARASSAAAAKIPTLMKSYAARESVLSYARNASALTKLPALAWRQSERTNSWSLRTSMSSPGLMPSTRAASTLSMSSASSVGSATTAAAAAAAAGSAVGSAAWPGVARPVVQTAVAVRPAISRCAAERTPDLPVR
jgi:hypothetical protein